MTSKKAIRALTQFRIEDFVSKANLIGGLYVYKPSDLRPQDVCVLHFLFGWDFALPVEAYIEEDLIHGGIMRDGVKITRRNILQ